MPGKIQKIFLTLMVVTITAGPWAVMQSFAWTSMLLNNLRTQSTSQAMLQTFDGNHPCPICKAIAAGKKSDKDSDPMAQQTRFEFLPSSHDIVLIAPERFERILASGQYAETLSHQPTPPPPRAILA